jgi:hypothetical protein
MREVHVKVANLFAIFPFPVGLRHGSVEESEVAVLFLLNWILLIVVVIAMVNMAIKFARTRHRSFLYSSLFWLFISAWLSHGIVWRW